MNAPYGICRCDALGILQDANPALVAMFGYASAAELTGRHLGSLYADAQQWFQTADYFHERKEFNNLTTECVRKDASAIVARISGRTIPNGKDEGSFEIFMEDVTETRMLELQFRQAQKMEAIGRLAGGIAHDFNNLLMVISGYSEFLLDRVGPDPRLRGPAQEISNATERATSLTRQLLAFSRKQMLTPKVLALNEVVNENLKMLTRMIGEDIDLVMVPGPVLGAVRADPGQIDQVIMNLAVNARDAMPQGGKLTIETANVTLDENFARTHTSLTAGDYVMLAISDTGVGMDTETQSRIFEPFFTTQGAKGTGLGLSTVYGIVKQSGGSISVPISRESMAEKKPPPRRILSAFPTPIAGGRPSSSSKMKPTSAVSPASIWKPRATRSSKPKTAPPLFKSSPATRAPSTSCSPMSLCPG